MLDSHIVCVDGVRVNNTKVIDCNLVVSFTDGTTKLYPLSNNCFITNTPTLPEEPQQNVYRYTTVPIKMIGQHCVSDVNIPGEYKITTTTLNDNIYFKIEIEADSYQFQNCNINNECFFAYFVNLVLPFNFKTKDDEITNNEFLGNQAVGTGYIQLDNGVLTPIKAVGFYSKFDGVVNNCEIEDAVLTDQNSIRFMNATQEVLTDPTDIFNYNELLSQCVSTVRKYNQIVLTPFDCDKTHNIKLIFEGYVNNI